MSTKVTLASLLVLIGSSIHAQTFGTPTISNVAAHSAHIVGEVSQDGCVQLSLGTTAGGPYHTFTSATYITNSPEVVLSGGGGSGAVVIIENLSNTGVPSGVGVVYGGSGYTGIPSATLVDRCVPSYPITGGSWAGGTATITTNSGLGSGNFKVGETVSITGVTPSGYDASNVTVTANDGNNHISYALASNPGAYTSGGLITSAPGSGATVTCSVSGGSLSSCTVLGGEWYHGENYNNRYTQFGQAVGSHYYFFSPGGLTPGTTYYGIITYRPDMNDSSGAVTSSQFSFTTSSCTGPCLPTLPQITFDPASPANNPNFYSTPSGYTVVPIAYNSGKNECAATSNVGPITYGGSGLGPGATWSVTSGDTMQTILNEVGYGAILDIAQGSQCPIPISYNGCPSPSSINYQGFYTLCALAVDPTATGGAINAANHRYIVVHTHENSVTDFPPEGYRMNTSSRWTSKLATFLSQTAKGAGTGPSNGEGFSTDSAYASANPVHHYWFENIETNTNITGNHGVAFVIGTPNNSFLQAYEPVYMVMDRLLITAPARVANTTTSHECMYGSPGGYFSVSNTYCGIMDDTTLAIGFYMTDCSAGPFNFSNNWVQAYGQGLYGEINGAPYCQGTIPTSPSTANPEISINDSTISKNTFYWPLTSLAGNALWDGLQRGSPRNQLEFKGGQRFLISGNLCNGQWAGQTEGECFALTPQGGTSVFGNSGFTDGAFVYNVITHAGLIATFSGTRSLDNAGPPDPQITARILIQGNYAFNIGKAQYSLSGSVCSQVACGSGIEPAYYSSANMGQDITIAGNTWPNISGDRGNGNSAFVDPTWWSVEAPSLMGGLTYRNNIQSIDGGGNATYGIGGSYPGSCCNNFPPSPLLNTSSVSSLFSTAFVSLNQGANINIPGFYGCNATPWCYMTDAQASTLAASLPSGDTVIGNASGCATTLGSSNNCLQQHLANAGVPGLNSGNPVCTATPQNPCAAGVNLQGLEAALGIVSNIVVRSGPGALEFSYTAPDSRACSVDTSSNGATWTRTTDSGGSRTRVLLVSNLSASTSYQYMIECYYSQTTAAFSAPWDNSNLVTDGVSAVTAASGTRTLPVSFALPNGATAVQFTVTGIGGTVAMQTCSSSPCQVPGVPNGAVLVQITYLSSGGKTISNGSFWTQ